MQPNRSLSAPEVDPIELARRDGTWPATIDPAVWRAAAENTEYIEALISNYNDGGEDDDYRWTSEGLRRALLLTAEDMADVCQIVRLIKHRKPGLIKKFSEGPTEFGSGDDLFWMSTGMCFGCDDYRHPMNIVVTSASTGSCGFAPGYVSAYCEPQDPSTAKGFDLDELFAALGLGSRGITEGRGKLDLCRLAAGGKDGPNWLIPDVMQVGEFTRLYAPAKQGKSLLALQWALELVRAGRRPLYADKENPPAEVSRRLAAMGATPDELGRLTYLSYPEWGKITGAAGAEALLADVEKYQADVLLLDSWTRYLLGSETAADEAAAYEAVILPLRTRGVSVIALDHTGHDGGRPRGTSDKLGDVDHGWRMSSKGERVTLTHAENRTVFGPDVIVYCRAAHPAPLWHERLTGENIRPPEREVKADKIVQAIEAMDDLSLSLDWGRGRISAALSAAGYRFGNDVLSEAINRRRETS